MTIPTRVPTGLVGDLIALQAYEVHKFYNRPQVEKDLTPSVDINAAMNIVGQQFSYYSDLHTEAEIQYGIFAELKDYAEAVMDKEYRKQLAAAGEKITEKTVSSSVATSKVMLEINRLARDAKAQVMYLKGTCDALRQRKDALIAISYNMREQMKGDPTVREAMGRKQSLSLQFTDADFGLD